MTISPMTVEGISLSSRLKSAVSTASAIAVICAELMGRLWQELTMPRSIFARS